MKFGILWTHNCNDGISDTTVECELFYVEESKLRHFDEEKLKTFLENCGLDFTMARKGKRLEASDTDIRKYMLIDIYKQCEKLVTDKYGASDEYGMELGWSTQDMAKVLGLVNSNNSNKRAKK